jgi:hypothetical protein
MKSKFHTIAMKNNSFSSRNLPDTAVSPKNSKINRPKSALRLRYQEARNRLNSPLSEEDTKVPDRRNTSNILNSSQIKASLNKQLFDREKKLRDDSQKGESAEVNFESVIESPPLSPVNNKELVEKVRRVD